MDIEVIKKLIKKYQPGHAKFVEEAGTANRYYRNKTDILFPEPKEKEDKEENPLRNADNRIPFNFHGLLVNQKASYLFTSPPLFDVGNKQSNKQLSAFLGDKYSKVCKDLCIDASNCTVGWLHVWKGESGGWTYAVVPAQQVIPVWSKSLEKKLLAVFRVYQDIDEETGESYTAYEYWNDRECVAYRLMAGDELEHLLPYRMFLVDPELCEWSEKYRHDTGEVPFFPFFNNNTDTNDLENIKPLIDTYCKVFSGFVNDLEDIQEVIFVLTNYGGEDLKQFLSDLKKYKAIQIENDGEGDKSGVSTLTIELPVEARKELLTVTRKCIFEQGMGIDPDPENFGNSSGVALKFLYSLLELKAGLQETEFREGFGRFIRCVCRIMGILVQDDIIKQTWTRTSVSNDLELSQIAQLSEGVIAQKTIISRHPWVEEVDAELEEIRKETEEQEKEADRKGNVYKNTFKGGGETEGEGMNDGEE